MYQRLSSLDTVIQSVSVSLCLVLGDSFEDATQWRCHPSSPLYSEPGWHHAHYAHYAHYAHKSQEEFNI